MKNRVVTLLLLAATLAGTLSCGGGRRKAAAGELSGDITLSGAFALYPLAVKWAEEFRKLHPAVNIDISAGGAGKGITDVLSGVVDLGMVSREVYAPEIDKGAVPFAVAKDAVVPILNVENPAIEQLLAKGLTREAATRLWIGGEDMTWGTLAASGERSAVHVYTRSDACGAAETFALWMGRKQEDLNGTGVFGDPGIAQAVQKDKLGVGYANLSYAYDETTRQPNPGLAVYPLDVDGDGRIGPDENFYATKDDVVAAIADDRYPSPPARNLFLVTNGTPAKPEVVAFLKFILTEGQKYNNPAGYIALADELLQAGLTLLGESAAQNPDSTATE
ncbi:MAG: substrate-binding domain-containing protein [Rikenellaceae bacterium]|jgi:phosphate transport system substrate-binding protein|nr:substrate-binding domain-containing protein [Rikenellaceae bacterium]